MKNFRVTVNGNTYEVSVEELSGNAVTPVVPASPAAAAPVAAVTPTPAATPAPAVAVADAVKIQSPMPGTVLDIKASVGDVVTANQVLLILEAMKMENEIVTPVAGTIAAVHITKGATVQTGDLLLSVRE